MINSKLEIPIDTEKARFEEFLNLLGNDRIIFSGIFGCGKTYFLRKFFDKHAKFIPIHIYPTNYSVSKNEDIFELIKYDILFELLGHSPDLDKLEVSSLNTLVYLDSADQFEIFKNFISAIPEIGKKVMSILQPLEHLITSLSKKIDAKQNELTINDAKHIKDFSDKLTKKQGHVYENDFYTQLITKLIASIKGKGHESDQADIEVVLIVDDLDRIDPEHIFRIINIFAVHFDVRDLNDDNKFGLDRIILSCDIDNVRLLFNSKYGTNTAFNGYIDKFYSREVFYFDNRKMVTEAIELIVESIQIKTKDVMPMWSNNSNDRNFLILLLKNLILSNILNLRSLTKLHNAEYFYGTFSLHRIDNRILSYQIAFFSVFQFLVHLFGGINNLVEAITKTEFRINKRSNYFLANLLLILDWRNHKFIKEGKENSEFVYSKLPSGNTYRYQIKVTWDENDNYSDFYTATTTSGGEISILDFRRAIISAIEAYAELTRDEEI
ncbi:hypothetical protein KK083_02155 [Fulvivirgaceae bacterium PWU4]|uniref:KAP NTPase domain-containing protein n=1 Tax=Chryseosolibacter histidini TaxID=2782349 RepID=A0AAP2GH49_9BACT|nr:P-loop NTPase fold protein [Chryseosolibacter histidini]MBT1695661.1 hypothetical protein [Chryseosolibacter histidini]